VKRTGSTVPIPLQMHNLGPTCDKAGSQSACIKTVASQAIPPVAEKMREANELVQLPEYEPHRNVSWCAST